MLFRKLLIRTKKDKSQIKKVFIREALGEKWMNSPKQPHDSILPYSEGMKMFTAFNSADKARNIDSKEITKISNMFCFEDVDAIHKLFYVANI